MIRVGVDVLDLGRFRHIARAAGESFLGRVYTDRERSEYSQNYLELGRCLSAKEAVSKLLATGLSLSGDAGVCCTEIEVLMPANRSTPASIRLAGEAETVRRALGVAEIAAFCGFSREVAYSVAGGGDATTINELRSALLEATDALARRLSRLDRCQSQRGENGDQATKDCRNR